MDKILNLYEKIQAVAKDIKGVEKDMQVSTGGSSSYRAVSDKNVVLKIKEAEYRHRIVSIPYRQELIASEILTTPPDSYGKVRTTFVDTVKMTTKIVDLDNPSDFIEVESFGRGVDASDKGFGKASTYARKYALLNAYKIATGVDPDEEASKPIEQGAKVDVMRLKVENYLLSNDDFREKSFQHFDHAEIGDFSGDEIRTIYVNLKNRGAI